MSKESIILQQSEWYIMEKLWEEHPRTIVQLYHALEENPGDIAYAQEKVYERTRWVIREFLRTTGNHSKLGGI